MTATSGAPKASAASASAATVTTPTATATAKGVTVTGLPAGQKTTVTDTGTQAAPSSGLAFLSDVYTLGPSGPLPSPAHVTIKLHAPASADTAVVVATREDPTQPWDYLSATLTPDGTTVSFDTPHFSLFGVLGYDLGQLATTFKTDFVDGIDGGMTQTVDQPACDNEQAARGDGYHIASSTTDTVYWCLGMDTAGHRVLKVTNHRRYPLQVLHPHMQTLTNPHDYLALASLSRLGSGPYAIVAPGVTATFNADLTPGSSEGIQTEMDGFGQSLYALETGVETMITVAGKIVGVGKTTGQVLETLLSSRSCADSLDKGGGAYIAGCFSPEQLVEALGKKALLLVPLMVFGPIVAFLHSEWNALIDQFNHHDQYRLVISRDAPTVDLSAFVGTWYGHTRGLTISPSGAGVEQVGDGCCDPVIDLNFQLSNVTGSDPAHATATATVTAVQVHPGWDNSAGPPPHVGQRATLTIDGGVLTDQLTDGTIYCTYAEDEKGTCGA